MQLRHLLFGLLCAIIGYYYALHGLSMFTVPFAAASNLFSICLVVLSMAFLLPIFLLLGLLIPVMVFMFFGRRRVLAYKWHKFN